MPDLQETQWGPLWRHMNDAHGLILVDDECNQIARAADEARMKANHPVAWILVNALHHLSQEELLTLGRAIAERDERCPCCDAKSVFVNKEGSDECMVCGNQWDTGRRTERSVSGNEKELATEPAPTETDYGNKQ